MKKIVSDVAGPARFTMTGPAAVVHADINGDGALDIAVLDAAGGRIAVWLGGPRGYAAAAAPERNDASVERLTRRETQVAALIAAGYTDAEIGRTLRIGRRTAETHSSNVLGKLGLRSRRELIRRRAPSAAP